MHLIDHEVPIFVYYPLMLPWVLATVLDLCDAKGAEDTAKNMTCATLHHYFRTVIKFTYRPTVLQTKREAMVDGILVAGSSKEQIARIEAYIDIEDHSKEIEEVEIQLADGAKPKIARLWVT
ncbi:hypothetical protein CC78DRAFT_127084 [Lojkania enalia]|uniref:Uncharacterized protein n=1 Tax=Lojkania enalia TaxID=147567 RepID=A0A9P4MXI2_9PLEO|nr:hypothetical protein CC78DRAFT_127084 [Didymosphaeria enalia]